MAENSISINSYKDYIEAWEKLKNNIPFDVIYKEIRCKYCNSKGISKYGYYKNVQRWWCKDCKRKFTDNDAYPSMKIPLNRLKAAVSMYYKGISLKTIRKQIEEEYNCFISDSTMHKWIRRLTKDSLVDCSSHKLKVGSVWLANETVTIVGVNKYWILDLIDARTHFVLASLLFTNHNINNIITLIQYAKDKANSIPGEIFTRRTSKYKKGVELALGLTAGQVQIKLLSKEDAFKLAKYWRSALKERAIVMSGLKLLDVAQLTLNGWVYYYNYHRTQESLKGNTPSKIAKFEGKIKNYTWVEESMKSNINNNLDRIGNISPVAAINNLSII